MDIDRYKRDDGTPVIAHVRRDPDIDKLKFSKKDMPKNMPEKKSANDSSKKKVVKNPAEEFNKKIFTERELKLLMRRVNDGKLKPSEVFDVNSLLYDGEGVSLTADQVAKGKAWLLNQWKTPRGVERINNPFRAREIGIMEDFLTIKFKDFYSERGNYYYPLYVVYGDNTSMEYYVSGGEMHIVG